ncbi:uncharacterized protein M6B38_128565 [Iris pallida]|uniref:Uncharacterized protein n=1 Tax=Iris pallida TaxID=29817 RepID=A0AAX6G4W5_IRIPA|nr:uncharacterized protein M6B38_128565 [Iris pallida]
MQTTPTTTQYTTTRTAANNFFTPQLSPDLHHASTTLPHLGPASAAIGLHRRPPPPHTFLPLLLLHFVTNGQHHHPSIHSPPPRSPCLPPQAAHGLPLAGELVRAAPCAQLPQQHDRTAAARALRARARARACGHRRRCRRRCRHSPLPRGRAHPWGRPHGGQRPLGCAVEAIRAF